MKFFALNTFLFITSGFILSFCSAEPPTEQECIAGLRNFMKLKLESEGIQDEDMEGMLASVPDAMAKVCVEKRNRKEVLCEIDAKTIAELKACRKSSTR